MYEYFDHTADVGIKMSADDLPTLLAEAGRALFGLIVDDFDRVECREDVAVEVAGRADQPDYLLFDWLNELLRLFEETGLVLRRFDVRIGADGVSGRGSGERLDPERHGLGNEVKAVTYHELNVTRTPDGWEGTVILDI